MSVKIIHNDCLNVMNQMIKDNIQVECIITDPPYGLNFMGKLWDHGVPAAPYWKAAYDLLPPGGYLLAFGGTRTFHRLACIIEDVGFEYRDTIMWIYGSGFPKSQNLKDEWEGWGTALKPAYEPIIVARKPFNGTVAANVETHGTGAMNIDACRVATDDNLNGGRYSDGKDESDGPTYGAGINRRSANDYVQPAGRWPANVTHDGSPEVMEAFAAFGQLRARGNVGAAKGGGGMYGHGPCMNDFGAGDAGTAARFFYSAKASKADRADSKHPTVKPIELMRWLVRLVCPPGGTVLDPFAGTGTTLAAAVMEGFNAIGIEKEEEYYNDIVNRMNNVEFEGEIKEVKREAIKENKELTLEQKQAIWDAAFKGSK